MWRAKQVRIFLVFLLLVGGAPAGGAIAAPDAATIATCAGLDWQESAFRQIPGLLEQLQPHGMKASEAYADTDVLKVLGRDGAVVHCQYISTSPACMAAGYQHIKQALASNNSKAAAGTSTNEQIKAFNDRLDVMDFFYDVERDSGGKPVFSHLRSDTPPLEDAPEQALIRLFDITALTAGMYCNASHNEPAELTEHIEGVISFLNVVDRLSR